MKLITFRETSGLSREEVAKVIDVDAESIRRYEHGERMPRPEILRRIAGWSNGAVTANDFIGIEDEDDPESAGPVGGGPQKTAAPAIAAE